MRYAIAFVADQTYVYLAPYMDLPLEEAHTITVCHPEAVLFDERSDAEAFVRKLGYDPDDPEAPCWIENVDDVDEFRKRENTW